MARGGVVAALVAHHQRRLAGEGGEFHLAIDAVGDVARQRGLAGAGIAEQPEHRRRAVLAGLCLQPVGNGLQRGILMRRKGCHVKISWGLGCGGHARGATQTGSKTNHSYAWCKRLPPRGMALRLDWVPTGNTLGETTSRSLGKTS